MARRPRVLLAAAALVAAAVPATALLSSSTGSAAPARSSTDRCPAVSGARPLPTAERVLGRPLTASPLTPEQSDAYLLALDAASPRIVTGVAGRTVQGRPLRYALVGDPRELSPRRLDAISVALRDVRRGRLDDRAVARAAAGPAVVWIGAGVHANEPSGTTAALEVLGRLGTDDSCATRRTLRATLAVVVPDQNPDGLAVRTRTNAADVDLNRDWFAVSQPETAARLRLLLRFPPTIALDAHEQSGGSYFVPPYADPVVRGLPSATRRLADRTVSPAIDRALRRVGTSATHRGYDLLYPGYADSATSLLLGAGGMTLEQGSDLPLAEKARHHEAAMLAALGTVADRREAAVRAWAAGFRSAVHDGRAGRGTTGDRAYGWVLRVEEHRGDATAVGARLRSQGVHVRVLRRATRLRIDPLGTVRARWTRLPAGTIVVPADQPLARWADVLLGRDASEAGRESDGADSWSVPRAAGIDAAVLRGALPVGALAPFRRPAVPRVADGTSVGFSGESAAGTRAALLALAAGRPVTRSADGTLRTTATRTWLRAAAKAGVSVRPAATAAGATPLRAPRVVMPEDPTPLMQGTPAQLPVSDRPAGWIAGTLRAAGTAPTVLDADALRRGIPAGTTHLVLGPAALPGGTSSPDVRASVERFVRAGGTVIAIGAAGTETASRLGVSAVRTSSSSRSASVAVRALPGTDPLGRSLGPPTSVLVAGEPGLVVPAGASVPLRAGSGAALEASGAVDAGAGLAGRPLVIDEVVGAGHVLTVGFSPAFRRQSAGGEHVLLTLLLAH